DIKRLCVGTRFFLIITIGPINSKKDTPFNTALMNGKTERLIAAIFPLVLLGIYFVAKMRITASIETAKMNKLCFISFLFASISSLFFMISHLLFNHVFLRLPYTTNHHDTH